MLEVELSFCDDLQVLMDFAEEMIKSSVALVDQGLKNSVIRSDRVATLLEKPFNRISYTDSVEELSKHSNLLKNNQVRWGLPLQAEREKFLSENIFKGPVFVYRYPATVKAFYMKSTNTAEELDRSTVECFDLLLPHVAEVMGGSLREDILEKLRRVMAIKGLKTSEYEWYLDLRRYGSVPHGGFGLGFDRLLQYLTGSNNIRDVMFIPRHISSNPTC